MDAARNKTLKSWVERLKGENKALKEKIRIHRKENLFVQKTLRECRKLIKDIPGCVVLIQDEKIILASDAVRKELGYTEEEVLGHSFSKFVHPDSVEFVSDLHKKRISGKFAPCQYETNMITKTGETLCCEVRVNGIRYQGRRAFLFDMIPIDHMKKVERQLYQSKKTEALACMASGVCQESNRFLDILDGLSPYFKQSETHSRKDLYGHIGRIDAVRQKGRSITQKLAALAKGEQGSSGEVLCDIKEIVQDAVSETRPRWEGKYGDHEVKIDVKTYLRTLSPVHGHPREIRDVFVGMILNSIDAVADGGEICLTTEENPGFAYLYIQDNGAGIADNIKERIFDPFFTTKDYPSMGLGLSVAHAVINRHKGKIEVISQEGQGATFIIKIPLAQEPPLSKARCPVPGKIIKDSRILAILDESIIMDLIYQLLVSKAGKVTAVQTAGESLKQLRKKKFDLVIADMNTLSLQPSKILARIKKIDKTLPVVLVNAEKKEEQGAGMIMGRPFETDKFLSLVSKALSRVESSE